MNVHTAAVRLLGAAALVACLAGWARAGSVVLDQAWETGPGGFTVWGQRPTLGTGRSAQTLTTGGSGDLVKVEVFGYKNENNPGPIVLEIHNGEPSGSLLFSMTQAEWGWAETWHTFDFSATPIHLADGQIISIALRLENEANPGVCLWRGGWFGPSPAGYTQGEAWNTYYTDPLGWRVQDGGNWDLMFRTYMDNFVPHSDVAVPEPGSMVLIAAGAAGMLGLAVRRRTREERA
jgi:hypothetical protein